MINVTPVILCGGSGTHLWPLSCIGSPKQFLRLTGKEKLALSQFLCESQQTQGATIGIPTS